MEKKIYEHIFKTTFDALLDGWIGDASRHARSRYGRVKYKKSAAVVVDDKEPPSTFYIHFSR